MQLEQIQQDFVDAIFGNQADSAVSHVKSDKILTAKQRVGIYRGSVHGILTTSLGITFPVCKALVGEEFFDKMCDAYIDQNPPSSPFFAEYGSTLNTFLAQFEPVKSLPYLSDTAHLEWTRHNIWHKQHPEPFDFSQLAKLTEKQQATLQFQLKPTMELIQSKYRIDLLWFAHQEDSEIALEDIDLDESVTLIIWKGLEGINIREMNAEDTSLWDFLYAISKDKNLTELANQFGDDLPVLLNTAIQEGWIQSFKTQ